MVRFQVRAIFRFLAFVFIGGFPFFSYADFLPNSEYWYFPNNPSINGPTADVVCMAYPYSNGWSFYDVIDYNVDSKWCRANNPSGVIVNDFIVQRAYVCPSNSSKNGNYCSCNSGYDEKDSQCVKLNHCEVGVSQNFPTFAGWLKPSGPSQYSQIEYVDQTTAKYCDGSCEYLFDVNDSFNSSAGDNNIHWDGTNLGQWTPFYFNFAYKNTGTSCSTVDDLSKPTAQLPPDSSCSPGQVPGQVNGNMVCVDSGTDNSGGGDKPGSGDQSGSGGSGSGGDGSSGGGDKPGTGDKPGGDGTGGGTASGGGDGTGGGTASGDGTGVGGAGAGDKSDDSLLCKLFPNVLACMELGDASDAPKESPEVPSQTANVNLVPDNTFSSGGTCPTDPVINLSFRFFTVPIYSKGCDLIIRYVRPLAIMLASFMALFIAVGGIKGD